MGKQVNPGRRFELSRSFVQKVQDELITPEFSRRISWPSGLPVDLGGTCYLSAADE